MRVPMSVEITLEQVQGKKPPAKVHVTVNGAPLCEQYSRAEFRKYPLKYVMVDDFKLNPCGSCMARLNHRATDELAYKVLAAESTS